MKAIDLHIHTIKTIFDADFSFDIKKCKGSKVYYRIRLGQYRIGLKYIHPDVLLICCLIRGEIYKTFPPK